MDELYKITTYEIRTLPRLIPSSMFISHLAPVPFFQDDIIYVVDNPGRISKRRR